jgi:DNA-directed RNA polymerase specialized sigma24 family protein
LKFIKNTSKLKQLDDAALVARYKASGELEVLGVLYNRYMHLVFGLCLNYLKDEEQSKDAVMQIFEELIIKVKAHEIKNFKSWLYVLSRNHCLMQLDMEDTRENRLSTMERCMETLTEEQRISVDLFYLQEKNYKEVAEITGYDLLKVKSYIQNGKRNLKICIEKNSGE